MVKAKSSSGGIVNVRVLGINNVIRRLRDDNQKISQGADFGVVRAGAYVEEEVKESIMGNRPEHKSVDTGQFGNSIEFKKTGYAQGVVEPKKERYPKSKSTTQDVALLMEKGTSRIQPRRHFGNTKVRTAPKVKEVIENEINKKVL